MNGGNIFSTFTKNDTCSRIDTCPNRSLFIGLDEKGRPMLLLVTQYSPEVLKSTGAIDVTVGRRKDKLWALTFSLNEPDLIDVFCQFCMDMAVSSAHISSERKAVSFLEKRYEQWLKIMPSGRKTKLSTERIKGLLGEMKFLQDFMMPKYGLKDAVLSWSGPDFAKQDFVLENTWFEVKTVSADAEVVSISSIDQLDTDVPGELVVMKVSPTGPKDSSGCTLNGLYKRILVKLENDPELRFSFKGKMLEAGYYPNPYYDGCVYRFEQQNHYEVNCDFPAIRRKNLPNAITKVQYQLSLSAIDRFRKGGSAT